MYSAVGAEQTWFRTGLRTAPWAPRPPRRSSPHQRERSAYALAPGRARASWPRQRGWGRGWQAWWTCGTAVVHISMMDHQRQNIFRPLHTSFTPYPVHTMPTQVCNNQHYLEPNSPNSPLGSSSSSSSCCFSTARPSLAAAAGPSAITFLAATGGTTFRAAAGGGVVREGPSSTLMALQAVHEGQWGSAAEARSAPQSGAQTERQG